MNPENTCNERGISDEGEQNPYTIQEKSSEAGVSRAGVQQITHEVFSFEADLPADLEDAMIASSIGIPCNIDPPVPTSKC